VNNDGFVSPIDALLIINQLNNAAAGGEAGPAIGPAMARSPGDSPGGAGGEGDRAIWWNEPSAPSELNGSAITRVTDPRSCRTLPRPLATSVVRWSNDAEADAHWHSDDSHADHDEHDPHAGHNAHDPHDGHDEFDEHDDLWDFAAAVGSLDVMAIDEVLAIEVHADEVHADEIQLDEAIRPAHVA
jgi:zinc transport system substrate-binding protein